MRYIASPEEFSKRKEEHKECVMIYSASWCGPCRALKEWITTDFHHLPVFIVDADNPDLEELCKGVSALPTIEIYQFGERVFTTQGFQKDKLQEHFDKIMTNYNHTMLEHEEEECVEVA